MFRTTDMVLIAVMVSAAAFTYKTKHDAERQYGEVRRLQSAINSEEDRIDVLKADWSLLTQPSRLQRLAERFHDELQLEPVDARQIADLDELPERQLEIEDFTEKRLGGVAENGIDDQKTGGVVQ